MINGFEPETAPLNDYEFTTLLPVIVEGLKTKIGKDRATKGGYICDVLKGLGLKINPPRLRKVISHIRSHGLVRRLIATKSGYYIATTDAELGSYVESLNQRIQAIEVIRDCAQAELNLSKNGLV